MSDATSNDFTQIFNALFLILSIASVYFMYLCFSELVKIRQLIETHGNKAAPDKLMKYGS